MEVRNAHENLSAFFATATAYYLSGLTSGQKSLFRGAILLATRKTIPFLCSRFKCDSTAFSLREPIVTDLAHIRPIIAFGNARKLLVPRFGTVRRIRELLPYVCESGRLSLYIPAAREWWEHPKNAQAAIEIVRASII